jgi:nanoRNase/pAp phosphatase (c-di-AMP/oligoRNAs hydrolase)
VAEVYAPKGLSRASRRLVELFQVKTSINFSSETVDAIILVDTNNVSQLDELGDLLKTINKPLIFIDHHYPHPEIVKLATLYIAEEASSTSEIIYKLFEEAGIMLQKEEAIAIFLGIAYDTRHFALATSQTLRIVCRLLDAGVVAEDALPLIMAHFESSERVARLKAAQRLTRLSVDGWILAVSRVGAFQASAARALVALGAHVAVVGGEKKGKLKISLRSSREFYNGTGVHLGRDVAALLSKYLTGAGGGHSTSAGFNGEGDLDKALNVCIKLLSKAIASTDKL